MDLRGSLITKLTAKTQKNPLIMASFGEIFLKKWPLFKVKRPERLESMSLLVVRKTQKRSKNKLKYKEKNRKRGKP